MGIEFNDKFLGQIERKLIPILEGVRFHSGMFVDHESLASLSTIDDMLQNRKQIFDELSPQLGETPLSTFFREHLIRIISDNAEWDANSSGLITELPFIGNGPEIAAKLTLLLTTLPWSYTVTYVLPESLDRLLSCDTNERAFSSEIRLLRVTEQTQNEFPLTSAHRRVRRQEGIASLLLGAELPIGRLLFQTMVTGYVGVYGRSEALRRAEMRLKAFLGFLLSARTLRVGFTYVSSPPKYDVVVYEKHSEKWEITRKSVADDDLSRLLSRIEINDVDGKITKEKMAGWIGFGHSRIHPGFRDNKAGNRLQLAAKWLAESYSNSQDLLAFVQAMICLEIVLGDEDDSQELGIGATIRNRCAYLIGNSYEEREEITDHLKAIYRVRSKIVHRGKDQLMRDDYIKLFMLRDYCVRVLARELETAGAETVA